MTRIGVLGGTCLEPGDGFIGVAHRRMSDHHRHDGAKRPVHLAGMAGEDIQNLNGLRAQTYSRAMFEKLSGAPDFIGAKAQVGGTIHESCAKE